MTRLTVGFIVLLTICALAIAWTMSAVHSICGAIQAILDIMHSRDKIENLACQRIVELQADKGRLIDELTDKSGSIHQLTEQLAEQDEQLVKAKEIIKIGLEGIKREFIVAGNTRPYAKEALELCNEYCEKAEDFLKVK